MMINIDTVGLVVNEMRERIKETVVFPVLGIMNHILGVDQRSVRVIFAVEPCLTTRVL
jgi:hypothetical protein